MHIKSFGKEGAGEIRRIGWRAGAVGILLLISAGLELLAHQVFGQTDVDTLLWALSLGFWTYILGFSGFLILSVQWFVRRRRVGTSQTAMNQSSCTQPKHRRFEEHELKGLPHILEQGMTPVDPGRSSWNDNDENEANSQTGVA